MSHKRPLTEICLNEDPVFGSRGNDTSKRSILSTWWSPLAIAMPGLRSLVSVATGKRPRVVGSHDQHYDDDEVEELIALAQSQPMPQPSFSHDIAAPSDHQDDPSRLQHDRASEAAPAQAATLAAASTELPVQQAASSEPEAYAENSEEAAGASCARKMRPARHAADIEGDYISVTSDTGERVYCGLSSSARAQTSEASQSRMQGQFLSKPIDDIMQEVCA